MSFYGNTDLVTIVTTLNTTLGEVRDNLTPLKYARYEDQKAQNTNGGTFTTGDWRTRTLNTEVYDPSGIGSLSSNQVTLVSGVYIISASAPANTVARHQCRLYNITDSASLAVGTCEATAGSDFDTTRSFVQTYQSFADATTIELQHRCSLTVNTTGFGIPSDFGTEVFSVLEVLRLGDV